MYVLVGQKADGVKLRCQLCYAPFWRARKFFSLFIWIVGKIKFLEIVRPWSPFPWWLSVRAIHSYRGPPHSMVCGPFLPFYEASNRGSSPSHTSHLSYLFSCHHGSLWSPYLPFSSAFKGRDFITVTQIIKDNLSILKSVTSICKVLSAM